MTEWREAGEPLPLSRTGPFVPPASIVWIADLLVTESTRLSLESAGLRGITFQPVFMKRIVKLDWRAWDLDATEPQRYPAGGEPEMYVLGRKHNPEMAEAIGPIHEVVISHSVEDGADVDLMRTSLPSGEVVATDRGRSILNEVAGDWLRFGPLVGD